MTVSRMIRRPERNEEEAHHLGCSRDKHHPRKLHRILVSYWKKKLFRGICCSNKAKAACFYWYSLNCVSWWLQIHLFANLFFLNQCIIYCEMRQNLCFGNSSVIKQTIQHRINGQVTFFGCFLQFRGKNPHAKLVFDTSQMHSVLNQNLFSGMIAYRHLRSGYYLLCVENTWTVVNRKKIFEYANCAPPFSSVH